MESQDNSPNTELKDDLQTEAPTDALSPPSSAKKSKAPLIISIVVAVVVLCAVCVVAVILGRQYLPILRPKLAASKLMPADAAFFASINVDIEDTAGFKHLDEIYGDIAEIEDALDEFLDEMEDELDISYKDDIKPWLGPELAIAVTNMEGVLKGDVEEPGIIIVAATRDTKASDAFLEKMLEYLEDQDYDVDKETYQDVTYHVAQPERGGGPPVILSTVKKSVILTLDEDDMEDVIDAAQGKSDSLADNERYTKLVGVLPADAVIHMFYDLEDLMEAGLKSFREELRYSGLELPSETFEYIEAFQACGLALSLDKEGVQLDVAITFDPDVLSDEVLETLGAEASANRILKRIPANVLGFVSSQNLAGAWKGAFAMLTEFPEAEEQLEDLEEQLGLKIDEELLDWLPGEFALALVKAKGIEDVPLGGFAIFEVDDQEGAEDTLKDIVDVLEKYAYLEFKDEDISGVEMQVLMDPDSEEIILGYGFTDEHVIIGFAEDALEKAIDDDIQSIADDETFKTVRKHLPRRTGGYFYVNVEATWRLAYKNMSDWDQDNFDENVRPFLEPIKAIGIAAPPTDPEKGISQGTLFLYIPGE